MYSCIARLAADAITGMRGHDRQQAAGRHCRKANDADTRCERAAVGHRSAGSLPHAHATMLDSMAGSYLDGDRNLAATGPARRAYSLRPVYKLFRVHDGYVWLRYTTAQWS